ncbi:MAG TPA: gephyrin-like molybdotransferase Glp, partial [Nitrospiria bacterium]
ADRDQPPWAQSAMDGYAVRSEETRGASAEHPVEAALMGEVAAGEMAVEPVSSGSACRIMTGAPVPPGSDSVVPLEYTREEQGQVLIFRSVKEGENIRPKAEDFGENQVVLNKGMVLNSGAVGLIAAAGRAEALVYTQPRVGVLATGNELTEPGEAAGEGQIRNSNSYALQAQIQEAGGEAWLLGIARDHAESVRSLILEGIGADMLLISGGVSVGKYDTVKETLSQLGAEPVFWRVAIKPGGPLAFWMLEGKPVFGLPGNPVSTMVTFEEFVRPVIREMAGHRILGRPMIEGVLLEPFTKKPGKTVFARVRVSRKNGRYHVRSSGIQSSGALKTMAMANGLMVVPAASGSLEAGAVVSVRLLDDWAWWLDEETEGFSESGGGGVWIRSGKT